MNLRSYLRKPFKNWNQLLGDSVLHKLPCLFADLWKSLHKGGGGRGVM